MNGYGRDGQLDSGFVAESYQAARDWLVDERARREVIDRRQEWIARRPRSRLERLIEQLERLGVGREERRRLYEERDRLIEAQGDAYREYLGTLESETHEDIRLAHSPGPADLKLLAPDAALAMPYAVLGMASERQILSEDFLAEEIHNPNIYAQKMDVNVRRPLIVDLWGEGTGTYLGLPDFDHTQWASVYWFHIYDPHWSPTPPASWSYYAHVWLHGALACWADDGTFDSLYARIEVDTRVKSFPLTHYGHPEKFLSDPPSEVVAKNFDYGGQNISVYLTDTWKWIHKLTPYPWHKDQAQWVIVGVDARATVRGYAHSKANFKAGGELPLPFGAYCPGVKIL